MGDSDPTQPDPHQPGLHDNPTAVRATGGCECYNVYTGLGECRNQCYQQNQLVGSECPCLESLNISGSGSCTCYDVYEGLGKCTRKCYVKNDFVGSSCPCPK